ncbi:amidase [Caenimonas terrae]|uniref:Amidase n=1 Tax=Caenimonas terrae TaxID=696074 RepID=A0ABW0NLE3_9BURK
MTDTDILDLNATALSRRIAQRDISCVQLMQASLARIEALNPQFNAIVSLRDAPTLLAEAKQRDDALAQGQRAGWMHGFPVAVKDLSDAQGLPTTMGSPAIGQRPAAADALFVQRMKAAGAIVIGKTNTPEFGLGSHTYNPVFGTTLNAYDPSRTAGGSSGGAAVALALRMLPVADGSDMGGSLRNPAAFNNLVGFRPSRGRVPAVPAEDAFFQQLGTEGPMGRSVEDVARLLSTMSGWDARAPLSLTDTLPDAEAPDPIGRAHGKRIGWLGSIWPDLPLEPGIVPLCEAALKRFGELGCVVEPCTLEFARERNWSAWLRLRQLLVGGKLGALYADPHKRALLKPEAVWEIEQSHALTAAQLYQASANRTALYQALRKLFERYDYLVAPTAQVFPFDATLTWPGQVAGTAMDTYHRWMEIVTPFTLAGLPVASMPVGFSAQGLPMGMQIVGPALADLDVLALARACESLTQWTERRRPAALA